MSDETPSFVELSVSSKSLKNSKYTKEMRAYHCETWQKSGLSMREYCNQAGLTISMFCQWIKSLGNNSTKDTLVKSEGISPNSMQLGMEIILVSGMRIRFANANNISEILRFIKALESCR